MLCTCRLVDVLCAGSCICLEYKPHWMRRRFGKACANLLPLKREAQAFTAIARGLQNELVFRLIFAVAR